MKAREAHWNLAPDSDIRSFLLTQSWRQELDHDTGLTKARIAASEGISYARVSQVMNLLELGIEEQPLRLAAWNLLYTLEPATAEELLDEIKRQGILEL